MIRLYIICSAFLVPVVPAVLYIICSVSLCDICSVFLFKTYFLGETLGCSTSQLLKGPLAFGPVDFQLHDFCTQLLLPSAAMTYLFVLVNRTWLMDSVLACVQCVSRDHFVQRSVVGKVYSVSAHYLISIFNTYTSRLKYTQYFCTLSAQHFLSPPSQPWRRRVKEEIAFLWCKNFQPTNLFPKPSHFILTSNSNIQNLIQYICRPSLSSITPSR